MALLTKSQKKFLVRSKIKVGRSYMFPAFGFEAYISPNGESTYIEANPATKSLANESFYVKEIKDGFCRGNFSYRPKGPDFWMEEEELSRHSLIVILLLLIICWLPMVFYNLWHGGVSKIETTINTNP